MGFVKFKFLEVRGNYEFLHNFKEDQQPKAQT